MEPTHKMSDFQKSLPIYQYHDKIIDLITKNQVYKNKF